MMKLSRWVSKNPARTTDRRFVVLIKLFGRAGMTFRASAASPIDFVSAAGTVGVAQDFIRGLMFTRIDFGVDYKVVRADEGN